jgi:hypothetical protein
MAEEPAPKPLDYYRVETAGAKMPYDAEYRWWQAIRQLYGFGLVALVGVITIPVFMNEIMFGQLTRLSPADFVVDAQTKCLPTVRAIRRYQAATGQLPDDLDKQLVPKYLPSLPWGQEMRNGFQFTAWDISRNSSHDIIYDFTPATEGWSVKGPFANGPLSLPKVPASGR